MAEDLYFYPFGCFHLPVVRRKVLVKGRLKTPWRDFIRLTSMAKAA
ncbi:hypothetical protein MCC93_08700 [Morococcus cerebrosus]|uniref:Uncharacterized protein n=1 Tax=Morococcus cerebrosus TaxID=1056807 RepID=A0A0C1GVT0_9NEIS|nr:hypothetical protein MCC93_08700 [Morococcus cerebrosus]